MFYENTWTELTMHLVLNKNERRKLISKLAGKKKEGGKHTMVTVTIPGAVPVKFGLTRDIKAGNNHIVDQMGISMNEIMGLVRCYRSQEWYHEKRQKVG